MVEEGLPIYKVKVQGQERKAIDLEALNNWLDNQIITNNPLASDTSKLPEGTTLEQYKGLVGWGMANELSFEVKSALGILEKPEAEEVVEPGLVPEPKKKEPEPKKEPELKTEEVKEPEVIEPDVVEPTADDEDVVVLQ